MENLISLLKKDFGVIDAQYDDDILYLKVDSIDSLINATIIGRTRDRVVNTRRVIIIEALKEDDYYKFILYFESKFLREIDREKLGGSIIGNLWTTGNRPDLEVLKKEARKISFLRKEERVAV